LRNLSSTFLKLIRERAIKSNKKLPCNCVVKSSFHCAYIIQWFDDFYRSKIVEFKRSTDMTHMHGTF